MSTAVPVQDQQAVQRRTVYVLASAQVLGGIGVAAGVAVGALLAADLGAESLSGLASAGSVVGAALIAIPVSRLMDARGRRPGLLLAYGIGITGALLIVAAATMRLFPLALLGLVMSGGGSAAGLQSRYAAADLATSERRGRSLATVVWATTVGSVLGPNLAQPMGDIAASLGVPQLAGPYLLAAIAFAAAALILLTLLRPDPLLTARSLAREAGNRDAGTARSSTRRPFLAVLGQIASTRQALVGLIAIAAGHATMVGVMSMTPLHLRHGDATLRIIGFVISMHITGMYIASPVVGLLADKLGRHAVIVGGGMILLLAVLLAGSSSGHQTAPLTVGLFLLGIGWSCTLIAGSTLLSESVPLDDRPEVQGTADFTMGIAGASAGVLSGVVVATASYAVLNLLGALLAATLITVAVRGRLTAAPR